MRLPFEVENDMEFNTNSSPNSHFFDDLFTFNMFIISWSPV